MPITLSPEDAAFLESIERLAQERLTQEQIAERMGLPYSTFRFKVRELGFEFTRSIQLAAKPQFGGLPYSTLLESGQITIRKPEPAA